MLDTDRQHREPGQGEEKAEQKKNPPQDRKIATPQWESTETQDPSVRWVQNQTTISNVFRKMESDLCLAWV